MVQVVWVSITKQLVGLMHRLYSVATVTGATIHTEAAVYPQGTLNGTPICSSHSGTALYETYLAGQEESGCDTFTFCLFEKRTEKND